MTLAADGVEALPERQITAARAIGEIAAGGRPRAAGRPARQPAGRGRGSGAPSAYPSHIPERAVVAPRRRWRRPPRPRPGRRTGRGPCASSRRPEPIEAIGPDPGRSAGVLPLARPRAPRAPRRGPRAPRRGMVAPAARRDRRPADVRDYYRVEDETGARYWLFRAGLYGAEPPRRSGGCMGWVRHPSPGGVRRAPGHHQLRLPARGLASRGTGDRRPRRWGLAAIGGLRPQQPGRRGARPCQGQGAARPPVHPHRLPARLRRRHAQRALLSHRPRGLRAPDPAAHRRPAARQEGRVRAAPGAISSTTARASCSSSSRRRAWTTASSAASTRAGDDFAGRVWLAAAARLRRPGPEAHRPAGRARPRRRRADGGDQRRALPRPRTAAAAGRADLHPREVHDRRGGPAAGGQRRAAPEVAGRDGAPVRAWPRGGGAHARDRRALPLLPRAS